MILEITQKGKSGSSRKLCLTMLAAASPEQLDQDGRPAKTTDRLFVEVDVGYPLAASHLTS